MGGSTPARPSGVPSSAVYWRGFWFDVQTRDMLVELARISGSIYVRPLQGCWSTETANSAGTHARACVVDLDCEHLSDADAERLEYLWRSMGGFGWFRPRTSPTGYVYGWQRHAHLAHPDGDMSSGLRDQWDDYLADRNGLANNGPDMGTRAFVGMTWARYREEHDVTPEQLATILARIDGLPKKVWTFPLVNRLTKKSWSAGSYLEGGNLQATQGNAAASRAAARIVALEATVAQLAQAQGLSDQELLATIGQRVDAALDGLRLTITTASEADQESAA